jgi:hypothetical protein
MGARMIWCELTSPSSVSSWLAFMSSRPREPRTSRTRPATRGPLRGASRGCGIRDGRADPCLGERPALEPGPADAGYEPRAPMTDKLNDELDLERARVLARDLSRAQGAEMLGYWVWL